MNYDNFKAGIDKPFVVHISYVLIFPLYFNYKSEKTAKMHLTVQEFRFSVLCEKAAYREQSSSSKIIKSRLVAVNTVKQK